MKNSYSHDEQYIAKLKSIEQQINDQQLDSAAQQLNQLAKTSSNDPRLFLLGARLAEAARNPEGMLQAARQAHKLAPQWSVATIYLAGILASRDEAKEAMQMAQKALQQGPADIELSIKAAAVAQRLNEHAQALQWLRQAEKTNPENLNIRYQIALTLTHSGEHAPAIVLFTELLQQRPNTPSVLNARLQACLSAQQTEQAILDGQALIAIDPNNEVYRFYSDIAQGLTPKTQPAPIVAGLFDGYAARFDRHLVVQLQYKLPRDVAAMIHQWHPDREGDILDLGCGTGLLGVCLGALKGVLVGVDLSAEMLEQASRHQVYDSLHHVNLLDALQATPANLYHVITALDVLIYVGNLETVIPNAHRILLAGGRFVFSCETGSDNSADYALQSTYRYTHQRSYVERLLLNAGFSNISITERVLRYEAGQPVQGFLVTAQK